MGAFLFGFWACMGVAVATLVMWLGALGTLYAIAWVMEEWRWIWRRRLASFVTKFKLAAGRGERG